MDMKACRTGAIVLCSVVWSTAAVLAQDAGGLGQVQIEGGLVEGVPSDTDGVTAFLGVPFAGSVEGENRWRPAPPVEPWDGVKVADTPGPMMLQDTGPNDPEASDAGLVMNIWTPAASADEALPVYMLIHGGANRMGSAQYDDLQAAGLAAKGVVVVSVQYRLGPMGWMALPEMIEESPEGAAGNFGLLDLVTALEWIRDNIEGFGGDPETVTFGGQSAGGENSVALLRTPLAEGLFDRAVISSSFTGFMPGKRVALESKLAQNQEAVNEVFGREMTLADLRAIPAETWMAEWEDTGESLYRHLDRVVANGQFYTIDGHTITEEFVDLLEEGDFEGLDILIGQSADEYPGLGGDPNGEFTDEEYREEMISRLEGRSYMPSTYTDEIFDMYQGETPLDNYRNVGRMRSDRLFQNVRIGAEFAKAHSDDADIWLWYWDHIPPGNNEGFQGAYHAADIYYFNASLDVDDPEQRNWTDPDLAMEELASTYLANFIKTGNPNGEGVPEWSQVGPDADGNFMRFHEGRGEMRTDTVYPTRDAYHRAQLLEGWDMTEDDLSAQ